MNKQNIVRAVYYTVGLLLLALGITLNTKAGLGVSAIISVPYCISNIIPVNFGNVTLIIYFIFVAIQFVLKGKDAKLYDILQIPLSIIFTRFMNLFSEYLNIPVESYIGRLFLLIFAVILTGFGAAMSLNMRLVPNPGDGIVQAIADKIHKEVGFTKNCFDVVNITISITISLLFQGKLIGIGIGTVIAVIGVGRTVSIFNHYFKEPMQIRAGMAE